MAKEIVLFNPLSGTCSADALKAKFSSDAEYYDLTKITDYKALFSSLDPQDTVILCGGDGTLNRFANLTADLEFPQEILYYAAGTGNDFAMDVKGEKYPERPFPVREYLKRLPTVTVNGQTYRYINGVGYGIDGYCCEVGDQLRGKSDKPVNYTAIAIKGLLFHYKPTNAKVTVDGVERTYKKVWLAPAMFGRYYGGGMLPTPGQTREDDTIATLVFHDSGKLRTLMIFPSIFKGEHVKHTKYVEVLKGKEISVEYDRPVALQIDGETFLGVTSYKAAAPQPAPVPAAAD